MAKANRIKRKTLHQLSEGEAQNDSFVSVDGGAFIECPITGDLYIHLLSERMPTIIGDHKHKVRKRAERWELDATTSQNINKLQKPRYPNPALAPHKYAPLDWIEEGW